MKRKKARRVMMMSDAPKGLKYDDKYSWVKVDGDTATIGLVKEQVEKAKEFVFVQLPEKGERLKKGKKYLSLEAVKWSGQVESPVSGEVTEVNEGLFDEPETINKDPYGKGWIAKVKLSDPDEIKKLE
ncbi:MAG: glycine cleavage system protein GcvH [Candidatus Woesearchaeota archaeon]